MRDLFVIIGSLLIAAVLAAFAVPRFIDWTPYKDEIEQRLAMATGLELKLLGPVRLEILPRLSLDAEDVTLDTKEVSLSAAHLVIEVSPASLIGGDPHIISAKLDRGVIKLAPGIIADPAAALVGLMSKGGRPLLVDSLGLSTVAIMRAGTAEHTPLAMIREGEGSLPTPGGPLRLTADGEFGGIGARARLAIGMPEAEGRRHVALAFDANGSAQARSWRMAFEGDTATGKVSPIMLDGALVLTQGSSTTPGAAGGENKDAALWRAQAKAHAESRAISFEEVEISRERAVALRLNGKAGLDLSGEPRLTLDLSARRLVLDPLIEGQAARANGAATGIGPAVAAVASSLTAALPKGLSVEFDIGAESVELAGESFERSRIKGVGRADNLVISSLGSNWSGRGELKFSGGGSPERGEMRGHVEVKAADAAAFMQGVGFGGEAAGAHIPLTLAGNISVTPESARLASLDLSLSGSKITGSLTFTRGRESEGPRIDADLASRDLDLDAWPLGAVTSLIPASLAGRLQVHVERLRAGKAVGDVGRLDMSLTRSRGETLIDELRLQGYEGLALSGSGSIGGAGSSFEARISSPKAAPLAALARLVLPQGAVEMLAARHDAIEPLALTLTARRATGSPNSDATLSGKVASSSLDAKGSLDPHLMPVSGEARLSAPEARTLLAQLGVAVGTGDALGNGEATLALKPDTSGGVSASASLIMGETKLTADGKIRLGDAPEGHGGFSAATPNLSSLARLLGYAPRLDGDQHFEMSGGWELSPDALALDRLNMRFLGKALTGTLRLELGSQRRLTGDVRAPVISVPALTGLALGPIRTPAKQAGSAPPSTGAIPGTASSGAASSWASARLPTYVPPPIPIAIDVSAPTADLGGAIAAGDARLTLEMNERGIALTGMRAPFAGGELGGEWRIERDGGLGRSVLRMRADGVRAEGLFPGSSLSGKLTGEVELAGSGESPAQILAGSGGGGTLSVTDGAVGEADIAGLRRSFVKVVNDDNLPDKQRLAALVASETARGPLTRLRFEAPVIATSGAVKLSFPRQELGSDEAVEGTVSLDLKTLTLDARLGLSTLSAGLPENRVPLAATIIWKGPLAAPKREVDATTLLQAVTVEQVRIRLERLELLEFDQREQQAFNRRLKSGRQKALPLLPSDQPASLPPPAIQPDSQPPKADSAKPNPTAISSPADPQPAGPPLRSPAQLPSPIVFAPGPSAVPPAGSPPPARPGPVEAPLPTPEPP